MYQVIKRDGKMVDFDLSKISAAIQKAFDALQKQYNQNIIDMLALKVTADYEPKIKDEKITVESIQDSVEDVLVQAGYADVAKCYILYRKQREKIRNMKNTMIDYKETVDKNTGKVLYRNLVLDNHSEVMYDYSLIPGELIIND